MECSGKLWALLEISHDSDLGPTDIDFSHKITLYSSAEEAEKARAEARRQVLNLPLSETCGISESREDLVVFESDDWWKWEILEVGAPSGGCCEGEVEIGAPSGGRYEGKVMADLRLVANGDQWGAVAELSDGREIPIWAVNGNEMTPPWLVDEKGYEKWHNLALDEAHKQGFRLEGECEGDAQLPKGDEDGQV